MRPSHPPSFAIVLALILLSVTVVQTVGAVEDPPVWMATWGGHGSQPGQFSSPSGITYGPDSYIYVADYANDRVQKLDPETGACVREFSGIQDPCGVAVIGEYLFITALNNGHIAIRNVASGSIYPSFGSSGSGPGQFWSPAQIFADKFNNLYVADSSNGRIQKLHWDGAALGYVSQFNGVGTPDGKLKNPVGVAVYNPTSSASDTRIFVAESFDDRVRVFDDAGHQLQKWGGSGTADGMFHYPYQFGIDGIGNVYVVDFGNDRVQKFTAYGAFLCAWGSKGTANGQFDGPCAIVGDTAGRLYVVDYRNNRIQKFAPPVGFLAAFSMTPNPAGCGQTVSFTDTSPGDPTSWSWTFGDGTTSTLQNPTHVYTMASSYTVSLQIRKEAKTALLSKTLIVEAPSGPITAGFTFSPSAPKAGEEVMFVDSSTGYPTGWTWNFGDGRSATVQNPKHVYATAGTYTASLTITRSGASPSTTTQTVTVAAATKPTAAFSFSPASPKTGREIAFTDASSGNPTGWLWTFGDGSSSSVQAAKHTYVTAGSYTVTLMVINAAGSSTATKTVTVTDVSLGAIPGGVGIPRDLDGDGKYEDVNGNGRTDFADVTLYFNQMTWIATNEPVAAFDYNGNGRIDFADVTWLFSHL
jgi:PKD repeat protein